MKYHQLEVSRQQRPTRVGRGISAGGGKTAGRGTKGQKARTGVKLRPGFEGGQLPLAKRMPKLRGFRSMHTPAEEVLTSQLNSLKSKQVDNFVLFENKMVTSPYTKAKLLFDEDVKAAYQVSLQGASAKVVASLQKAGGSFQRIAIVKRTTSQKSDQ